jgi:spermidine/putrescine transport system permease protein
VGLTDSGFVPDTLRIALRTLGAAASTSAACIALAFPTALWIASRPAHRRPMLLALAAIPMGTNIVVRSYAWMLLLGPGSPFAAFAGAVGLIEPGSSLHPSWLAVSLGMIAASLPLAIISLYASVERLDWRLADAARDLHASRLRTAWHGVVVPAWPGLLAAFTLTFVPALGSFVIPDLLGGAKHWMIGNLVQQQFGTSRNWPYGAALGLLLVAGTIPAVVVLSRRRAGASEAGGGVPRASRAATWFAAGSFLLLYLPMLAVVVASFASTKTGLSFGALTLEWYRSVLRDARLMELAANTLTLAAVSTAISTVLGTMLALSLERFPWRAGLRSAVDGMLTLPVVMPDVLLAAGVVVAMGVLRRASDLFEPGMSAMVLGHVSFQLAFVTMVVRARLASVGTACEEAAADLHATGLTRLRRVTLPLLAPGIAGGAMLAFTLSLDDFVISFMTASPSSTTLPVHIYASVRRGLRPELHALSAILFFVTALIVPLAHRLARRPTIAP